MSLRLALLPAVALSLVACVTTTPETPPLAGSCNADAAAAYVGKPADAATVEASRTSAGAQRVRTLKPGQMVTMEYLQGRLNLHLDTNGNIERVSCG